MMNNGMRFVRVLVIHTWFVKNRKSDVGHANNSADAPNKNGLADPKVTAANAKVHACNVARTSASVRTHK